MTRRDAGPPLRGRYLQTAVRRDQSYEYAGAKARETWREGKRTMKWITRSGVKVDRVACPWLIRKFVDPDPEFMFVPSDQVAAIAEREQATPFDTAGAELGHHGKECTFDAFCRKYRLWEKDPALVLMAKIVNGADTDNTMWSQPESWGLKAIAEGFRHLGLGDDHGINDAEWIVYDALYAYCQQCVAKGQPEGQFRKAAG